MTRRRFMTGSGQASAASPRARSSCPASASRSARSSRRRTQPWQAGRPPRRLRRRHLRPARRSRSSPAIGEPGKTTVYVRKDNPSVDNEPRDEYNAVHRDLDALHAPRLPGPLRRGRRATSSARATAASTTSTARSIGGPPVRPLDRFQTRVADGQVEIGPRFSVNSELEPLPPPRPGRVTRTASGSTSTRRGPRCRKLPQVPEPCRSFQGPSTAQPPGQPGAPTPKRRRQGVRRRRRRPSTATEARRRRRRLGRRAHRRSPASSPGCCSARCRRGPTGSTRSARRRCSRSSSQAVTGVFLAMYYTPSPTQAYDSITPHHQRRLPRRVRARHAQVGRVGDGHPDLPAHGPDLLLRRLQVPARAQLGDRRRAADPDDGDGASPATCCRSTSAPTGRRSSASTSTAPARSSARTWPTSCAPAPSSARPRCRASTRSTCCSCPALIIALIGAHLYLVVKLGTTAPPWIQRRSRPKRCARSEVRA